MKQKQFRTVVQLIVGIVALAIMAFWVHTGDLEGTNALVYVGIILSAFGFSVVGHQQAKK